MKKPILPKSRFMSTKPHLRARKLSVAGKSAFGPAPGDMAFSPSSTPGNPAQAFSGGPALDAAPGDSGS